MEDRSELTVIREARRLIERMRDRLTRPSFQALEICTTELSAAAECIRRLDALPRFGKVLNVAR